MLGELLGGVAQVSGVWSLAAFAIAALVASLANRKGKVPPITWAIVIVVALLGLTPIAGSLYVQLAADRNVYQMRVNVTDPKGRAIADAVVTNSLGNHADKKVGAWQFEIPKQVLPADGRVTVYASVPDAFLHGAKDVVLDGDLYPAVTVIVGPDEAARVRGIVQDPAGKALAGVRVSVEGYGGESLVTDDTGSFALPAHAADGQQVALRAEKAGYQPTTLWHPAGRSPATLILNRD